MRLAPVLLSLLIPGCAADMTAGDDQSVNCALETRDDAFAPGFAKAGDGQKLNFTVMTSNPEAPARGDNAWVIQLNQMTSGVVGAAIDGAAMTVTPYMPDHGHPSGKTVHIVPTGTAGQYELTPINLWMPGLWETTIDASSTGGDDSVVIRVCIPS